MEMVVHHNLPLLLILSLTACADTNTIYEDSEFTPVVIQGDDDTYLGPLESPPEAGSVAHQGTDIGRIWPEGPYLVRPSWRDPEPEEIRPWIDGIPFPDTGDDDSAEDDDTVPEQPENSSLP